MYVETGNEQGLSEVMGDLGTGGKRGKKQALEKWDW